MHQPPPVLKLLFRFLEASTAGLKHLLAGQIIAALLLLLLRL